MYWILYTLQTFSLSCQVAKNNAIDGLQEEIPALHTLHIILWNYVVANENLVIHITDLPQSRQSMDWPNISYKKIRMALLYWLFVLISKTFSFPPSPQATKYK